MWLPQACFWCPSCSSPIVSPKNGLVVCNSRDVAEVFGKEHRHVLGDTDNLLSLGGPDLGSLFTARMDYHPSARKMVRSFDMTKDGFTLLAMRCPQI